MINKVKIYKLKEIKSSAGSIIKYIDNKKRFFKGFGEVYFNEIKKGHTKGWNLHKECKSLIYVSHGTVKFTLMNRSKKRKKVFKITRSNPSILCIPPRLWFKFESITNFSIIVNFINKLHNKNEIEKFPL